MSDDKPRVSGDNKDLLDLCRLNQFEEGVADSVAIDRNKTLEAIDYAKRQQVMRLLNNPSPIDPKAKQRHIKNNAPTYKDLPPVWLCGLCESTFELYADYEAHLEVNRGGKCMLRDGDE